MRCSSPKLHRHDCQRTEAVKDSWEIEVSQRITEYYDLQGQGCLPVFYALLSRPIGGSIDDVKKPNWTSCNDSEDMRLAGRCGFRC